MEAGKFTSLREAADFADKSHETIRKWCKDLGIGDCKDGVWVIDKAKLQFVLDARRLGGVK